MANMENKYKHMDYVQSAISRMASNSFHIKGWNVTIIAAIVALSFKESDWRIYACALALNFVFWFLDAYYLRQEKLFRELYDLISCAKEWRANKKSFQSALDYIYLSKDIIIKQDVLIS